MTRTVRIAILGALAGSSVLAGPVLADSLTLGAGGGFAPDYMGSEDYMPIPFPYFEYVNQYVTVRSNGIGLEADIIPSQAVQAGPIVTYELGRDNGVENEQVSDLPSLDGSLLVGGFIASGIPLSMLNIDGGGLLIGRISAVQGVSGGNDGAEIEASFGLLQGFGDNFTLIAAATGSYMSDSYAERNFGISAKGAALSGLDQYDADGGIRDVGFVAIGSYTLTEQWSATGIFSYSRLLNDAADSPITDDVGNPNQFFGGMTLNYQWQFSDLKF